MRKIIRGKLYDLRTAKQIATDTFTDEDDARVTEGLWRTPGGAFFMVTEKIGPDRDQFAQPIVRHDWEAYTREQAERWFNTGVNVDLFDESVFAAPDEATEEDEQERTVSLTVRVPSGLRDQLARAAAKESISMNSYLVRCAKRCLAA